MPQCCIEHAGISGGEKRRVSVGCQLLLNPSLIFMDEPTTGLDAFTSHNLIETLVNLSRRGRTVFISIHQPRSDIFKLFDSVILLSKGQLIYSGPGREQMIKYFSALDYDIPQDVNPADFFIDISSIDVRDASRERKTNEQVDALIQAWKQYSAKTSLPTTETPEPPNSANRKVAPSADIEMAQIPTNSTSTESSIPVLQSAGFVLQTMILMRRSFKNLLRDNLALWGNLFEVLLVASVFGAIFYKVLCFIQNSLYSLMTRWQVS